jgi:hypothetical protein
VQILRLQIGATILGGATYFAVVLILSWRKAEIWIYPEDDRPIQFRRATKPIQYWLTMACCVGIIGALVWWGSRFFLR